VQQLIHAEAREEVAREQGFGNKSGLAGKRISPPLFDPRGESFNAPSPQVTFGPVFLPDFGANRVPTGCINHAFVAHGTHPLLLNYSRLMPPIA
jgi:hypothetical protein